MKQSISLITLGVANYARAKAFYEALGWTVAYDVEETAFFQANGVVLTLWARDKLAVDTGVEDDGSRWSGVTLAHNVGSREEVDAVIEQARRNGAEISREPAETFYGGYAGVFRDLDGHAWEVAHNPGFGLGPDGSVTLPGQDFSAGEAAMVGRLPDGGSSGATGPRWTALAGRSLGGARGGIRPVVRLSGRIKAAWGRTITFRRSTVKPGVYAFAIRFSAAMSPSRVTVLVSRPFRVTPNRR